VTEKQKFGKIINLGIEITQVKDLDVLLERILKEARFLVNADAGSIYVKEDDKLKFSYTQNDTLQQRQPGRKLIYSTFKMPINNQSIAGYGGEYRGPAEPAGRLQAVFDPSLLIQPHVRRPFGVSYAVYAHLPLKTNRGDTIGVLQLIMRRTTRERRPLFRTGRAPGTALCQYGRRRHRTSPDDPRHDPPDHQNGGAAGSKETGAHVNRVASYSVAIYEHWPRSAISPRGPRKEPRYPAHGGHAPRRW